MQAQSCTDWGSNPNSATYWLCDLGLSEPQSPPVQSGINNSTHLKVFWEDLIILPLIVSALW